MRSKNLVSCAAIAFGLILAANATPAFAAWETIVQQPRADNIDCSDEHLRMANRIPNDGNRIRVLAGFIGAIEIYGHFIDQSSSASLSGVGGSGSRKTDIFKKRGGLENGPRGCGNVGSIVMDLAIPRDAEAGNATLLVGDERILLTIVKPYATAMQWAQQSQEGGSVFGPSASSRPSNGSSPPPPPPPPVTVTSGSGGGCNENGGPGCNRPNGLRVGSVISGISSGSSRDDIPSLPPAIGGCIEDFGGSLTLTGRDMIITLPTIRDVRGVQECLSRPLYFNFDLDVERVQLDGRRSFASLDYNQGLYRGFTPPTINIVGAARPEQRNLSYDFFTVLLPEDMRENLVGTREIRISTSQSNLGSLKLTVLSNPVAGIGNIAPFAGRSALMGLDLRMAFDLTGSERSQVPISWRLRQAPSTGSNPADCFMQIAGTLNALSSRPITTFDLRMKAESESTCQSQRFLLDITVADSALSAVNSFIAPYMRTLDFTPGPKASITPGFRIGVPRS